MGNGFLLRTDTRFSDVSSIPLLLILFVAGIFFIAEHDLFCSISNSFGSTLDDVVNSTAEGRLSRRISFLSLGVFGCIGLLRGRGYRLSVNGGYGLLMLLFLGWAGLSVLWAEDMGLTMRRLIILAAFCLTAASLSKRMQFSDVIRVAFLVTGAYLLIGFAAELALHTFHPFSPEYRFQGTLHPNQQSNECALLVISALALRAQARKGPGRLFFTAAAVVAVIFLLLTKSRTSAAGLVLAVAAFQIIASPNFRRHGLALSFSIIAIIFLLFGGALFPTVKHSASLGREETTSLSLNGRVSLWSACISDLEQAPVMPLGFGYGGFWTPERIEQISTAQNWGESERQGVGTAHSMYLDIFLALGPVGLLLWIAILFGGIRSAIQRYSRTRSAECGFMILLLIFCALESMLESSPFNNSFYMLIFFQVLAFLGFRRPYRHREDLSR